MKLHNTPSGKKELLQPTNNTVILYTCGLTVYSHPHIGNWLGYIYWDVLVRTLEARGYMVIRTQNITDVGHLTSDDDDGDDKMEVGARREGLTAWDVAAKYIAIAEREAASLNLLPPDHLVRATDYIDAQIEFVKSLEAKGYTYVIPGDGVYYDTSRFPRYADFAHLDIQGLDAGARVSVEGKRNITDFALWKFSPTDTTRDMEWDSPWGKGFPGWHLECSVIAHETLGDQLDIHTGGIDHIPVHHTNEIAQTEAVTGQQFSQFWLHVNHIKVDGAKMSKSLGNIYTLDDVTARGYSPEAFRVFALSKHYRKEGNFTWDALDIAANRLKSWQNLAALRYQPIDLPSDVAVSASLITGGYQRLIDGDYQREIDNALDDDLNTPEALMVLDRVAKAISYIPRGGEQALVTFLEYIDQILGLQLSLVADIDDHERQLLSNRELARAAHDWSGSDAIRDELATRGITVRDARYGQIWERI